MLDVRDKVIHHSCTTTASPRINDVYILLLIDGIFTRVISYICAANLRLVDLLLNGGEGEVGSRSKLAQVKLLLLRFAQIYRVVQTGGAFSSAFNGRSFC